MNRSEPLSRYTTTDSGEVIIDVAASRVQDLYNDFDRNAPYVKRDLDQDLVDYLVECAHEIGRRPFVIRISLAEAPPESVCTRIRQSIQNFFQYLGELEKRRMRRTRTTSIVLLVVGLFFFTITLSANRLVSGEGGLLPGLLIEGMTVAAWVSLWEAIATFFIGWPPFRRKMRLYSGLAAAPVLITASTDEPVPTEQRGSG